VLCNQFGQLIIETSVETPKGRKFLIAPRVLGATAGPGALSAQNQPNADVAIYVGNPGYVKVTMRSEKERQSHHLMAVSVNLHDDP
jgi:hypothetical protein